MEIAFEKGKEDTKEYVSTDCSGTHGFEDSVLNLVFGEGNICSHHRVQEIYLIPNVLPGINQRGT